MRRPAVFLDRDDTINANASLPDAAWDGVTPGDLLKPEYALLIDGARDAIRSLKDAGYAVVVITNQGGIARGGGTAEDVEGVNDALRALLNGTDAPHPALGDQLVDSWYFAPHHPSGTVTHYCDDHEWRKPNGGMVAAACEELGLDPASSWMIGDKQRDIEAALNAGVPRDQCLLISPKGDAPDLAHAAKKVLAPAPGASGEAIDLPEVTQASRVTLRAPDESFVPMKDTRTREMVRAIALGIAERTGIQVHAIECDEKQVKAVVGTHRLAAMALMAQLRRDSNRWHERQFGVSLWDARP